MTRALILMVVLAGCAAPVAPQPHFPPCPARVPTPAPLRKGENVGVLEIRIELAREKERDRGDACAATVDSMRAWIASHK